MLKEWKFKDGAYAVVRDSFLNKRANEIVQDGNLISGLAFKVKELADDDEMEFNPMDDTQFQSLKPTTGALNSRDDGHFSSRSFLDRIHSRLVSSDAQHRATLCRKGT